MRKKQQERYQKPTASMVPPRRPRCQRRQQVPLPPPLPLQAAERNQRPPRHQDEVILALKARISPPPLKKTTVNRGRPLTRSSLPVLTASRASMPLPRLHRVALGLRYHVHRLNRRHWRVETRVLRLLSSSPPQNPKNLRETTASNSTRLHLPGHHRRATRQRGVPSLDALAELRTKTRRIRGLELPRHRRRERGAAARGAWTHQTKVRCHKGRRTMAQGHISLLISMRCKERWMRLGVKWGLEAESLMLQAHVFVDMI